ncbi:metal ABC transporter solute-binding protein, Zn/Mn family [Paenisporosarcina indica]|uniref:metal ABC transporter solute-binding protein, Zn/Mn family n=1 Tax=Paenisporosarcina indica TaxID=650093 RepID=UPI00094F5EC0|nr:zinc ABC transporter substrate-binding protein [Paenisporosarcina indica]
MKKLLILSLVSSLVIFLTACGSTTNTPSKNQNGLTVFTTVYPLTYFTERIGGKLVKVESVYPAGSNEHTFDPTQQNMMELADADLFFYIGLGLEGFVESAKKTLASENVTMIATADAVSDEALEAGNQANENEHTEEHENEEESHEGHSHGKIDPHLWISPQISQQLALSIKKSLIEKDPKNEGTYSQNYEELVSELGELDQAFKEMADSSDNKTFFVSHDAFGYLASTYGLEQVAVAGLNSQDEPSQRELTDIVKLAKEKNITTILFEQNVSSNLAKVIQNEIGAQALTMHNLGVLTKQDIDQKETYFTLMEQNLKTLQKALQSSN